MSNLASDESTLAAKIEKKQVEIERVQKRLLVLQRARHVCTRIALHALTCAQTAVHG